MAVVNSYATLANLKSELSVTDTTDDTLLELALGAASRQIDAYCSRRFWQDATVVARTYPVSSTKTANLVFTDDISTTTGLVIKLDTDNDRTYTTTLVVTTDYVLAPANAALEVPVRPYETIRLYPLATSYPVYPSWPSIQVTAKFGWPAIPDDVNNACLLQAGQLFKSKDAVFGVAGFGDAGALRVRASMNPIAEGLLDPYRKVVIGS